jgi:hypothetical protein
MTREAYLLLADAVLMVHLVYIAWVIFGAILTRGHPRLAVLHVATLLWAIIAQTTPAPCPLTVAENWCEAHAGLAPYHGRFLLHYLDATVYPNVPLALLVTVGLLVCAFNLGVYVQRFRKRHSLA